MINKAGQIESHSAVMLRVSFYENHNLNIPAYMAGILMFDALRDSSGRQLITFLIVFRIVSAVSEQLCASNYQ